MIKILFAAVLFLSFSILSFAQNNDDASIPLPSVRFKGISCTLNVQSIPLLNAAAQKIKDHPSCKVIVTGFCAKDKVASQRSWDRVNAVIDYLFLKRGIAQDRFIFRYGEEGPNCNIVDLVGTFDAEGPSIIPAPFPNLKRKN